jgi:hypothetical protein
LIDLKTRAVAPFFSDARTFHNIYKLQKHALLRHQSFLIVFIPVLSSNFSLFHITVIRASLDESAIRAVSDDKPLKEGQMFGVSS